ncbi:hypothetical protein HPB50_000773 [Hyalomma asiaticum]|uniref:Uncharacterized protein n=1 Tax=Hyalomma asiaticum TaxID=266040 RepID=A0ACB7SU79_HYAAI|nr:hypothetical protein HPB50_000773 [Hyalomma asiaticum]
MHSPEGGATPEEVELCAVTDKLGRGVDALLAPCTFDKLRQIQRESVEFAVRMVIAEQVVQEADGECEISSEEVPGRRPDSKEGSRAQSHASANEADNELFINEQREDSSLRAAWDQAREETHGMFMPGSLLYHRELVNERQCREPVVRETRHGEVSATAYGAPRDGHFSGNERNERLRNALFGHVTSDTGEHCQSCREPESS